MPVLLLAAASVFIPSSDTAAAPETGALDATELEDFSVESESDSEAAPKCSDVVQIRCAYCSYYLNPGTGFDYRFCDQGRAGFSEKFCNAWALNRCPVI